MSKNRLIFFAGLVLVFIIGSFGLFLLKNNGNENGGKIIQDSNKSLKQIIGDKAIAQKMKEAEIGTDGEKRDIIGVERGVMMAEAVYTHRADLMDVSGGKATGIAKAGYANGVYNLSASFAGLAEPQNGDFYEGWLVREKPFDFISTGRVDKIGGIYSNLYKSETDLIDYNFYILTIEPNDGDPAPADHILEGALKNK